MPPSPVSPETTTHWQPEERITSSNASVSRRTAPSKALRSSGSGRLNRIFDTHKVIQSSKTVGVPRRVTEFRKGGANVLSKLERTFERPPVFRAAGTVPPDAFRHRRIVRSCFSCSDIQHRTVGPLKNPGLRTCAFAAPRAAEIESQIRLIHDAALYGSGSPFGKGVPGYVIFFMRENVASVVHHESSASTFPMRNIHFSDVFNI